MVGADGVPGEMSTKKLPSRKIRGRIFITASLWIGRPLPLISIVTTAASLPGLPSILDLVDVDAGDAHGGVLADRVGRLEDGLDAEAVRERDVLGEAEEDADAGHDEDHEAHDEGARARAVLARHALVVGGLPAPDHCWGFVVSVLAGWVPGVFPMTCLPTANGSLPASHSLGWPGDAVCGYGLVCR